MRLMASDVRVGNIVIINDYDRPCCRNLVILTAVDSLNRRARGRYLTEGQYQDTVLTCDLNGITPVNDFGYAVECDGRLLTVFPSDEYPHRARYADNTPRFWQPEGDEPESLPMKEQFQQTWKGQPILSETE